MAKKNAGSVLVVVAHPDDEVLGCGATIHKLVSQGWQAHLAVMSAGIGGRHSTDKTVSKQIQAEQKYLAAQMKQAASIIGYKYIHTFDFPDNRMDTISRMDVAQAIRSIIDSAKPDLIFTHHPGDYNWDHSITFDAVMMAARCNPPEFSPKEIRTFEVLSSTERAWQNESRIFAPNLYIDITQHIDAKKQAMKIYKNEYRAYPHPRSVEAIEYLARKRGNEVGLTHAESFHIVRKIEQ